MQICECYNKGYCMGTKEKEKCSCGGEELKCDFYDKFHPDIKGEYYPLFNAVEYINNCYDKGELRTLEYLAHLRIEALGG